MTVRTRGFGVLVLAAALGAAVAGAGAVVSPLAAQDASAPGPGVPPAVPAAPTPEWRPEQQGVAIPTRDGAALAADVYLPAKEGRYPAIVIQTPYDRTKLRAGLGRVGAAATGAADGTARSGEFLAGLTDREHYAYVVTDWRGFFGSRAAATGARVGTLGRDGCDVVEWAAAQSWCDGKVGTWGPSALGVVQYQTAAEAPPHLVCAVPVVAAYGYRYEDYFQDGVLREHHVASLDRLGFGVGARVRDARDPAGMLYRAARLAERPQAIDVPMLVVTGWFDHGTERTLETFAALLAQGGPKAREGSRLLVGPWHHMAVDLPEQGDLTFPLAAGEGAVTALAFFDRHLRGVGEGGFAAGERVRFWRAGEENWFRVAGWPRPGVTQRTLTLHADGKIDALPARADEPSRAFLDDPENAVPTVGGANLPLAGLAAGPRDQRPLLARKDVLVYTTEPLDAAIRLEGAATVTVSVATDAPDTDVSVRLCQVQDDGRSILLADSIARASFRRDGTRALLQPGEPREVTVRLPPLAVTFPRYGRLRVIVAGTNAPRFERNAHTGSPVFEPSRAVAAEVEVLHDAAHAARLVLPIAPDEPKPAAPR